MGGFRITLDFMPQGRFINDSVVDIPTKLLCLFSCRLYFFSISTYNAHFIAVFVNC